jgi:hypothetical protein
MENVHCMTLIIVAVASVACGSEAVTGQAIDEREIKKSQAALDFIEQAFAEGAASPNAGANVERLETAATKVAEMTSDNYEVRAVLIRALKESRQHPPGEAVIGLRSALVEAREILTFRPVVEAPRPKGFPAWTPVGEIRINRYPAYRLARTAASDSEQAAFWTLFKHIESNGIAMTAPVEISYGSSESDDPDDRRARTMGFLYASTEIGQTGSDGKVDVMDVPEATAVSIGMRGETTEVAIAEAESKLKSWLAGRQGKYEVAGELRVLGYNSPMIPVGKRYFEVQLPIRELQDSN